MNVSVNIEENAGPGLAAVISRLRGAGRGELMRAAVTELQREVADHLRGLAASRHDTANRLGARPTNHLAQAAEKAAAPAAVSVVSGDGVEAEGALTIDHPGLSRAFHDVTIIAKDAKALTIPLHAMAYGRRAGEIEGLFRPKGTNILAITEPDGGLLPLYALVRSVTQKQDRSLLPSDRALEQAAATGAIEYTRKATEGLLS